MLLLIHMHVPLPPCGLHGFHETTTTPSFTVFGVTSAIYEGPKLDMPMDLVVSRLLILNMTLFCQVYQ